MNIDGKYVSENVRMALLREEEAQLGLWSLEYPNAALVSARLVQILPQKAAQTSGPEAAGTASAQNSHCNRGQVEEMDGALLGAMA